MAQVRGSSTLAAEYSAAVDRDSAREMLEAQAAQPVPAVPEAGPEPRRESAPRQSRPRQEENPMMDIAMDAAKVIGRELIRGFFGNRKRRRR